MQSFHRNYPSKLDSPILYPLLGPKKEESTIQDYQKAIQKFESNCNKSIIETLGRLGIQATTKTDPYSLPYQKEIIVPMMGESYLNGPYEFYSVARKIVKELLNSQVYKIRFYFYVEIKTEATFPKMYGEVVYHFRYYEH
jgi:hypothetical protein